MQSGGIARHYSESATGATTSSSGGGGRQPSEPVTVTEKKVAPTILLTSSVREPAKEPSASESFPLSGFEGLQQRSGFGDERGLFVGVVAGSPGDREAKYLWTVDTRGLNLIREATAVPFHDAPAEEFPTKHTNVSAAATVAGECWFPDGDCGNAIVINCSSARFGHKTNAGDGGATPEQYNRAKEWFESLGYVVTQVPFGENGYTR
jgi:hypothetical protein